MFYVLGPLSSLSRIHSIPLNAPVTDFTFTPAQDAIFVLLDQTWRYSHAATKEQRDAARSEAVGKNIVLLTLSGDKVTYCYRLMPAMRVHIRVLSNSSQRTLKPQNCGHHC